MATPLNSVAVFTPWPITDSSYYTALSSFSCRRRSATLRDAKGLKIRPSSLTPLLGSSSHIPISRSRLANVGRVACESRDSAVEVEAVSVATWRSLVLDSESPVLVEFWAPWCGPCRMIHPIVDELAKQYVGKLKCYKVNTDEYPSIATEYGVRSIPSVVIVKNGEKKDIIVGAVPKSTLTKNIEKFL